MKQRSTRILALLLSLALMLSAVSAMAMAAPAEEAPAVRAASNAEEGIVGMWLWNDSMTKYGASTLFPIMQRQALPTYTSSLRVPPVVSTPPH